MYCFQAIFFPIYHHFILDLHNICPRLSVYFNHSGVSESLQPHGLQHTRLRCPLPTPGVYSTHVLRVGDAIQPSHPLLFPSIFSSIRVFSSESVLCINWTKYWSFCFSISPSNEYLGLISFRMDWLDLLAVQGTLKSLLQHHSSKASIFWPCFLCSPTLTSIHDYWRNHSFDSMDLCQQSSVSAF